MRILVASHTYIVDLNCEKLRQLAALGADVTVVVPQRWRPGGVQNRLIEPEPLQDLNFRRLPVANWSENNQGLLTFKGQIIRLLREFKPEIIHVEQGAKALGYAQLITLNWLLGLGAKNCFFTWWNLPYQNKFPINLLEKYNLWQTHGLISGNQDGLNILRDRGYRGLATVLPQLGIDERIFRPQPQPELRQELAIAPDEFVIGFVGRFVPEKGILTLIQALAGLLDQAWRFLLLGRGELREEILQKSAELGLSERIILVESVPHDVVPKYINVMNVLVLPSETSWRFKTLTSVGWQEQFGHVLIEAMGCKVPVIGSDSGEIPHVIGEAGLIFPEGNREQLRDRLTQLLVSRDRAAELAQKGYDRAQEKYTNRAIAKQQLVFYEQVRSVAR